MHMIFSPPRYHGTLLGAMVMNDAVENYFLPCRAAFTDNSQEAGLPAIGPNSW
jgi:hypothetical protein